MRSPLHQSHSSPASDHSGDESESDSEQSPSTTSNAIQQQLASLSVADDELDVTLLNPLSPQVINNQATINIGESCPFSSMLLSRWKKEKEKRCWSGIDTFEK